MQMGGVSIESIECLPFFLVTIECRELVPNLLSYSWRIRSLCLVPVTMIVSYSPSVVESNIALVGTRIGAALDRIKNAVGMLRAVAGQAVCVETGTLFFKTRFLCSLSLIFFSNKQAVRVGFGGKFGDMA